jgi:hypothetical protein
LSFKDGESIESEGLFFKISKGSGAVENLLETSTDASILLHFESFDPIGKNFCADAGSAGMCVNVYVSIRKKKAPVIPELVLKLVLLKLLLPIARKVGLNV